MKHFSFVAGLSAFVILAGETAQAAPGIPYPAALAQANVTETKLDNMGNESLVIGNGEMNAMVYAHGNDIHIRVAKNDCWDMRVDTSKDPQMPFIDVPKGKVVNGHGATQSWKTPNPTALPCGEIVLAGGSDAITGGSLDLAKAVATVSTGSGPIEVRVLGQSNVILIHSARDLSFLGILKILTEKGLSNWVSPSDETQQRYKVLHQNIPGDEDASGMDFYMVAGKKDDLQAVAVVTSRDSAHPLEDATSLVDSTLNDASAIPKHEAIWTDFWSKSGIQLADQELQSWWYRMVYFNRVFARAGGNAIGLAACFDHLAGWHNSLKLNYNIQQTYLAAASANHPELIEPFIDVLLRNLPRGEWFAKTSFGCDGAFFHSDLWPFEPNPANCKTPFAHQQTYLPYGYSWGMDGHTMVVIWEYYQFAPTAQHLAKIYPLIKDFGTFYCSILEKCPLENGKRRMGPSYFPELGGYNEFNVCYDINFVTAGMRIAKEAATLNHDAPFLARINALIDQIPTYGETPDPEQGGQTVIEQWSGAKINNGADRHGTMVQGIFPAGIITWFSPESLKQLGIRTINKVEKSSSHANSNVTINISRARLGLTDDAIANAKLRFSSSGKDSTEEPNGLFFWKAHGNYITEQVAISRFVSELLLQSVDGIIRVFPAWPKTQDGHFSHLLAEGGFEVSADQVGGVITQVTIHSTVGGIVKIVSPWPGGFTVTIQPQRKSDSSVPVTQGERFSSFPTGALNDYVLHPL